MSLSYDVISEFVKITNDKKEKPKEETVYATIVQTSDGKYVKIDGSDLVTPTETTTDIEDGERVTVLIKDHSAIITGNISSPSASGNRVNGIVDVVNEKLGVFETIVADKIDVNELHAYKAEIEHLIANKAEINDLKANTAEIKILNAEFANIKTLVNGNLTSDNILAFHITSDKVTMADAFIKDAMIATVNAAKINAGQLNTNMVSIGSSDGSMLINGSTQQFKDKNGNVRIQIGKDSTGDFTFVLYGEDGEGQIINQNGITASAVSDGLIVNDMINDNAAISGGKLDISSVIAKINEDDSATIVSSKIFLDQENQSLEVAFGSLKTHVDTIQNESIDGTLADVVEKTQSNLTKITANTEGIKSLVSQSEIAKSEINDMKNSFQSTTTELSNKYTTLSQSLDGFKLEAADTFAKKTTVEDLENNLATNYTTTEAMNSAIEMNAERVALSVSEARIKDIKLGGANLLLNSDVKKQLDVPESGAYNHISYQLVDEYSGLTLNSDRTFVLSFIADRIDNLDLEGWDSISLDDGWHHRWLREDLDKLIHIKDQTFKFVMKPKTIPNGARLADKLTFISENGYGGSIIYNAMLVEGDTAFDWQPAYSDIKTKMSQIEVNADSIATSVAKQEVENLKIGGTNLYNKTCEIATYGGVSNLTRTETGFSFLGVESNDGSVRVFNLITSPGWYTVSFEVKNNHEPWDMNVEINDGYIGTVVVPNDHYRYASFSYYVPESGYTDYYTFVDFEGLSAQTYDIRNFKVEKGNKATDYSPSFTDITNSIARIDVKADSITSTVSSNYTTLNNKFSNYPTTTQMNSAIQQKADSITSTVSSNYTTLNNKFNNYPTTTQMNSAITQLANKIETKVDVNGVKSTISQSASEVLVAFNTAGDWDGTTGNKGRILFNADGIHSKAPDGSYSTIGKGQMTHYIAGSFRKYHSLMKQGWIDTIDFGGIGSAGWSATITLPSEFKDKVFSVIPAITYVGCPNIADAIKMFEINIPHNEVNYTNGTFKVYIYASGLWAEGLSVTNAIRVRATWIAIA